MKSIKRLFVAIFSLALCASIFAVPTAFAESGTYVFDQQNVLSSSDFSSLEAKGADYAKQYNMGVYLLITDTMGTSDPSASERNEFGRSFFLKNNLGVGSGKNGIIFVIAVKSRDYVTVKHIDSGGNDPFSNDCVDALESEVTSHLKNNDWTGGAKAYYSVVGDQLEYFATTGKQWKEGDPIGLLLKILAMLGIPAGVAAAVVRGDKNAMQTARQQTEASNYLEPGSLVLSESTDQFINTTMTVAPLPKDDDKDSGGGWSDMGGGFSGSGGGKF